MMNEKKMPLQGGMKDLSGRGKPSFGTININAIFTRLRRNGMYFLGAVMASVIVLAAILAPILAPHDPIFQNTVMRLTPPIWAEGGSREYLLGTDQLGRDMLSRLLYGARVSLIIAAIAVSLSGSVGLFLGLVSGQLGGRVDTLIMGVADAQLAFPSVLLAIAIVSVLGTSFQNLVLVLTISGWVGFARIARGTALSVKHKDFVLAARAVGAVDGRIMFRHILPQVITSIVAIANIQLTMTILAESALSFLGLGVQPPTATWGSMVSDGRGYIWNAPWICIFPGLAIMWTVLGFTYLGEWVRVKLDPKYRGTRA